MVDHIPDDLFLLRRGCVDVTLAIPLVDVVVIGRHTLQTRNDGEVADIYPGLAARLLHDGEILRPGKPRHPRHKYQYRCNY